MTTLSFLKGVVYAIWVWAWAHILPVAHFLGLTVALVVLDLYTGVRAAQHRKEPIRSRGFGRTTEKITLYFVAILLSRGMHLVFFAPMGVKFDLVWLVAGLISLTEFKSNLENIGTVTGMDIWGSISQYIPKLPMPKIKKDKDA
jgi:hypothetical protein